MCPPNFFLWKWHSLNYTQESAKLDIKLNNYRNRYWIGYGLKQVCWLKLCLSFNWLNDRVFQGQVLPAKPFLNIFLCPPIFFWGGALLCPPHKKCGHPCCRMKRLLVNFCQDGKIQLLISRLGVFLTGLKCPCFVF